MKSVFWQLVSLNIKSNFTANYTTGARKKASQTGTMVLYLVLVVYLLGVFGWTAYTMAQQYASANMTELLVVAGLLYSLLFIVLNTIFSVNRYILGAKDYDFLMSMPIKKSTIILSKFASLLLLCYAFEFLGLLPFLVMYFAFSGVTVLGILFSIVAFIVFPLFPIAISYLLWLFIGWITQNLPQKQLITIIFSVLLLFGILYLSMYFNELLTAFDLNNVNASIATVILYPLISTAQAICFGNWLSLLWTILICVIPFVFVVFLTQRFYTGLNYIFVAHPKAKKVDIAKGQKVRSPFFAMYHKEMQRLVGSPMYMLNTCMGAIMLIVLSIIMGVTMRDVSGDIDAMNVLKDMNLFLSGFYIILMLAMTNPMASSISLEGKTWWQLKSMPVSFNQIIWSKMLVYITFFAPCAVISVIISCICYGLSVWAGAVLLLLSMLVLLFFGLFGLVLNLKKYNFNWTNEIMVVKQGAPVMINMLVAFAIAFLFLILYFVLFMGLISSLLYLGIICILFAIGTTILLVYINKNGKQLFDAIEC